MPYRSSKNQNRVEFIRKKFETSVSEEKYNTDSKKTNDRVSKAKSNEISKCSNIDKTETKAVIKRTPAFRREKTAFVKPLAKMPSQKTENTVIGFILSESVHTNLEHQSQNVKVKETEKTFVGNTIKQIERSKTDFFRHSNINNSNKFDSIKSTLISRRLNLLSESETNKKDILSYAVVNKNLKKKNVEQSDLKLSESLRKALQSPLPEGPPPKKPPRTFCHIPNTITSNINTQMLEHQKLVPKDIPKLKSKLEKLERVIKTHDKYINVTAPKKDFEKILEKKLNVIPKTSDNRSLPYNSNKKNETQLCLNLSSCILPATDPHICEKLGKNESFLGTEKKKDLEPKNWMPEAANKYCINGDEEETNKSKSEPIYDLPYVNKRGNDLYNNYNCNNNKFDALTKKPEEGLHYLCTDVVGRLNHSLAEFSFEMNRTKSFDGDFETGKESGKQSFSNKLKISSSLGNINENKKLSIALPNALTLGADVYTVTWDSYQTNGFETNSPKSGSDSCSTVSTPENVISSVESSISNIINSKVVREEIELYPSNKGEIILSTTGNKKDYIKTVSTKLFIGIPYWKQLKENDCSHLFECCLLVGLTFESDKNVPYIKTIFPADVKPPPLIEALCFPDASNWPLNAENNIPEEQYYSLVITNENGERKFGYCRRVLPEGGHLCLPLAYCIISPHKANGFFYRVLQELESRHGSPGIENFIMQLYESHFPGPGEGLQLKKILEKAKKNSPPSKEEYVSSTLVRRPCDVRLEEKDLTQLFEHLRLSEFLHVFSSLLHERKVLLLSNSLRKLSTCIEALQSILLPFTWQHTYIPVLPAHLLEMCEAPTPYVIGLLKSESVTQPLANIIFDNGIIVDLDESKIVKYCECEGFILPEKLIKSLKYSLNLAINASDLSDANKNVVISDAFISFFVQVCGHYSKFLYVNENQKIFEEKEFINYVTSSTTRSFLEWFTKTAMFQAFIHERLHGGEDDVPAKLFTRRAMENDTDALKNSTRIIKNCKVINKKVKTLGDKIRDFIQ